MAKQLQTLRIKGSSMEGHAPITLPWWSLVKGPVLMPSSCQHSVPKLALLYQSIQVLECSQPTDTERMDAHCKEIACLAVYAGDDSRTPEQRLEGRGSRAAASRVVRRTASEMPWDATNHKALHLSTVEQAEKPVGKQAGIRDSFLNRSLGQEVSQRSRIAKGGKAHHWLAAVPGLNQRPSRVWASCGRLSGSSNAHRTGSCCLRFFLGGED